MNNVRVILKDRLDKIHIINSKNNEPFRIFLKRHYIPRDSIICYVNDNIVDDQTYIIKDVDKIVIDMVRAYQLPEYCRMLRLWEDKGVESTSYNLDSIYTKNIL